MDTGYACEGRDWSSLRTRNENVFYDLEDDTFEHESTHAYNKKFKKVAKKCKYAIRNSILNEKDKIFSTFFAIS